MTIAAAPPIVVRLFELISLIFPKGAAVPSLRATVPPAQLHPVRPPSFAAQPNGLVRDAGSPGGVRPLGSCSDYPDKELERQ